MKTAKQKKQQRSSEVASESVLLPTDIQSEAEPEFFFDELTAREKRNLNKKQIALLQEMQNTFNIEDRIDKCILYEVTGYQADADGDEFWNIHYDPDFDSLGPVQTWIQE